MSKQYHYRCKSNPRAPILTLMAWEAKDMKNHPDYERVDQYGELIVEEDELEGTIPFMGAQGRK
jgi:hypothetical protein